LFSGTIETIWNAVGNVSGALGVEIQATVVDVQVALELVEPARMGQNHAHTPVSKKKWHHFAQDIKKSTLFLKFLDS